MPANHKRHNPLKDSSDIFAEEYQTPAEKIMAGWPSSAPKISDEDLRSIPELTEKIQQYNPRLSPQQAETEILELLDKYYNGDRDVPTEQRYKNKDSYKHQLIQKFQEWGFIYVEKKHYALSRPEKHLIRVDFYGTINKPRKDQMSDAYRKNKAIFPGTPSDKRTSAEERTENTSPDLPVRYELADYNLNTSPAWCLMRIFPRFHKLENKIRFQMLKQGINPKILPYLNIYDYSDILYNHFKEKSTKDDSCATIFLGARHSFVKDIFLKHEAWLRHFFKRHNYNERYVEALVKSAQSKGITGNIELKTNTKDFMLDYIRRNKNKFSDFIRTQAQSGRHVEKIMEQLENPKLPLNEEMRGFIYQNEAAFRSHFKYKHITSRQIRAVFELLSQEDMPLYLKENLKAFAVKNEQDYQNFLSTQGFGNEEIQANVKQLKNRPAEFLDMWLLKAFARENKSLLHETLSKENRDDNYIKFVDNVLNPPQIPEYIRENLQNFMSAQATAVPAKNPGDRKMWDYLFKEIDANGITPENYDSVRTYILNHYKEYSDYFKKNNIFTYQELNEQLTDTTNFLIKTRGLPTYAHLFTQNFITRNKDVFRYWYASFQQEKYQNTAAKHIERIKTTGLTSKDFAAVSQFISQRLDMFTSFCNARGIQLSSEEINRIFRLGNFFAASRPSSETELGILKQHTEQFIKQNSYIYKRTLVQRQLTQKKKEADMLLQKIAKQGITQSLVPVAHKFVLNNKHLFNNDFYNSSEDNDYAMGILQNIRTQTAGRETQDQAKSFICSQRDAFEKYIGSAESIEKYISNLQEQINGDVSSAETSYWSVKYISANTADFEQYLNDEKIGDDNIRLFMEKIDTENLSENIKTTFGKKGISLHFNDGAVISFPTLAVHHKCAVQDGYEQINANDISPAAKTENTISGQRQISAATYPNLAAANYFNNLCLIIDNPYHIQFFHGMDSTENYDNCERYIARLYPADPNVIFFGSLDPQDQLSYDYSHDPRTIRYREHTERMIQVNKEAEKENPTNPDMTFYVITGSRQGRR